ncbi:MAG: HD-GYP domain-containing protein, partial [Fimbriimonadaceae bacterium]
MKNLRQLGHATTELHLPGEDKPEIWKVDAVQQTNGELLLFAKDVTQLKQAERDALRHSRNLATIHKFESLMSQDPEAPSTVLQRMLEHAIADLDVEGACILVKNETGDRLVHVACAGLSLDVPGLIDLPQGLDLPWKALSLGRICASKEDLRLEPYEARRDFFSSQGLVHHLAVPLVMQQRYRGVLELHHRFPIEVDNLFVEVLQTLASMLAASFERVEFVRELEKANSALLQSYDATIEGWVGLLDARDNESEGHSKRVCELTLRLCRHFGVPEEQLTDIRRGALLHDIAKVAIPDNILLKPGPLDEEEWAVMKTHPEVAQRVLAKVPFLKQAADIPFCHHERWDGSGYPQGLSGEDIPLAARIFAVVDVFDALISERPYRRAWTCEKALGYIEEQAGKQFDPNVVEAFLDMMELDGYSRSNLNVG